MKDNKSFTIGMRVRMTELALSQRLHGIIVNRRTGIVIAHGNLSHLIRVKRDGEESSSAYHIDFWEPLSEEKGIADTCRYCPTCGQKLP